MVFLVLLLAVWDNHLIWYLRMICSGFVAALVVISGLHYSITVSRQLHAGD